MSFIDEGIDMNDDPSPEYDVAVRRSNTATTGSSSVHWRSRFDDPPAPLKSILCSYSQSTRPNGRTDIVGSVSRALPRRRPERYLYSYNLVAGAAPLQFLISVEPANGRPTHGRYTFRLSLKVDKVERPVSEPVSLTLSVDPRKLEFVVFVFPGKTSIPVGCLYSYRVWLRVNGVDHRLFGEDELWIAKDPDFSSIADASFARLKSVTPNSQVYDAVVGRARVQFVVRWRAVHDDLYKYSLEYEANGVGGVLIDDFRLILQGDPRKVTFLIYSVPVNSIPAGASHRLRVWLKSYVPVVTDPSSSSSYSVSFNDSYIFQRIWKSDSFKIGAHLDFMTLGNRMILGVSSGGPKTIVMASSPPRSRSASYDSKDVVEIG